MANALCKAQFNIINNRMQDPLLSKNLKAKKPVTSYIKEAILDNTPVVIALHDKDHNIIWANKAYQQAAGLSLQELEGKKCYSVWKLKQPCTGCPVTQAIETGKPCTAELSPQNQEYWPHDQKS